MMSSPLCFSNRHTAHQSRKIVFMSSGTDSSKIDKSSDVSILRIEYLIVIGVYPVCHINGNLTGNRYFLFIIFILYLINFFTGFVIANIF